MHSIATRSQQLSSLILSGKYRVSSSVLFALSRPYWQSHSSRRWYKTTITNITMASLRPSLVFSRFESDYSRSRVHFILEGRDENVETAKPRELTTLHLGKISKTHGSKSHHGLRKWVCFNFIDLWKTQSSSLHHPSSMTSFRTAFSNEHMNRITEERSRVNWPRESVCLRIGPCYDSCPESERYRTSVVLMFSLHRINYRMIPPWILYPSRRSLVKLVSYHSCSCTSRISLCVKLLHSRKWR